MNKRRWVWVLFLILLVALLAVLATRWNVAWFHSTDRHVVEPILGTLGFLVTMAGVILFFARLLQEMRLNQLQSEFLAAVTHELKTPISTIELSSTLLREDASLSKDEIERLWKSHESELRRLKTEVEALLEAARWDAKSVKTKKQDIDLEEWLNERITSWKNTLDEKAKIAREGVALDFPIQADPKILSLIADNLVDNAKKFAKNSPEITIVTRLPEERGLLGGKKWQIEFRDQGWGFDPKDAKKIFKRFYRAKTTAPYSIAGTGLGLYLADAAAKRMGIRIRAESPGPGLGSSFFLEGKIHE